MKFQKILSYDCYGSDPSKRFNSVCALLSQTRNPQSGEPNQLNCHGRLVFVSPQLRALTAIDSATASKIIIEPTLNEIPFDLKRFCTAEYFGNYGSAAVREAFLSLFVHDQLAIPREQLHAEVEHTISLSQEHVDALAISHTFRLRLLDVYLKTGRQLFSRPERIYDHLDPQIHWMSFGEIFNVAHL